MAAKKPPRVLIAKEELEKMTKEDLQKCWLRQDQYIDYLEIKLNASTEQSELQSLRDSEEKLKQQQLEATRRENILVMRLTTKEQEMQEYVSQIAELKQAQVPSVAQLRSALLDPAVNLLFERMRTETDILTQRLQETQNELSAWKFTPDSNTGKRLMAKCRLLHQENEELGKVVSSGRMAKLEGDLALQKSFSQEMKKSQSELDEFLLELDEDVEGMQSTIYYLQQQLREAKDRDRCHQRVLLPNGSPRANTPPPPHSPTPLHPPSPLQTDLVSLNSRRPRTPPIEEKIERAEEQADKKPAVAASTEEFVLMNKQPIVVTIPRDTTNVQPSVIVKLENVTSNTNTSTDNEVKRITSVLTDGLVGASQSDAQPIAEVVPPTVATDSKKAPPRRSLGGRKRTRARTPETKETEIVPAPPTTRKRLRRQVTMSTNAVQEKPRTALEIDADTEVQVAQTLANWATKRSESAVGNGEVKDGK